MNLNGGFSEREQRGTEKWFCSSIFRVCLKKVFAEPKELFIGSKMAYSVALYEVPKIGEKS